jgi:hypothetical protein
MDVDKKAGFFNRKKEKLVEEVPSDPSAVISGRQGFARSWK